MAETAKKPTGNRSANELRNDETKLEALQEAFPQKMKGSILQYAISARAY